MSSIFVSHAHADLAVVDEFSDTVLKNGFELTKKEIFYSSGADTGIPDGKDLLAEVRTAVGDAVLVIAIISPNFQTRPVCVAELGAAWSRTDNLFPIAMPGMARADMEGVMEGVLVGYLDEGATLDRLYDRVTDALGDREKSVTTWNRYKRKWLAGVDSFVKELDQPLTITEAEVRELNEAKRAAEEALRVSEKERRDLKKIIDAYKAARTNDERKEALRPETETEQFQELADQAFTAVRRLKPIVAESVFFYLRGEELNIDVYEDRDKLMKAQGATVSGDLVEGSNGGFEPNLQIEEVETAYAAAEELESMISGGSEEFEEWFRSAYGAPPDLSLQRVWDEIVLTRV